VPLQTLDRLVKEEDGGVFDPEDIAVMATAFDRVLADLKLVDRNDPIVRMLAKLVIELGTNRNAIYKTLFDARRKLRAALVANGYIDPNTPGRS
jgi:hypothetical protein